MRWTTVLLALAFLGVPKLMAAEHLQPAGRNPLADNSPGGAIVRNILKDWTRRQSKFSTVQFLLQGETVVKQGAYSNEPGCLEQMPSGISGDVPSDDYRYGFDMALALDLSGNRVRREFHGEIFFLSETKFIPDSEIDLFDGKRFQNYAPRATNTSTKCRPPKYQSELTLAGTKAPMMFFHPIDNPMFFALGIIPAGKTPLTPRNLKRPLDESLFSFAGKPHYKGREVVVLTYSPWPGWTRELWIDPLRDGSIVCAIRKCGSQTAGRLEITHHKTKDGWYPKGWTCTTFDPQNRIASIDTVSVVEMTFDAMLDASQFHVEPTPGMVVCDGVRDIRYVQGEPGRPNVIVDSR